MGIITAEEAKLKLSEWNVLLKYMDFLQANGFTDCGKGQILGQASLVREFLIDNVISDSECPNDVQVTQDTLKKGVQGPENTIENDLPLNIKDKDSENGSGLLNQVSNLVSEGLKEEDRLVALQKNESLSGEYREMANGSTLSHEKPRGLVSRRTEALVTKELNGSWLDKIKRITEIEEWR